MSATSNPYVVVISGMPGSGKTTLGWELSRRLHVPFLSRDDIKTGLHVTHRSDDPDEVWRFAERAFEVFYGAATSYLNAGVSIVIEAAFHSERSQADLAALAAHATLVHIAVETPTDVSLRRYRERAEAGQRHPAHNDLQFADAMEDGTKEVGVYRVELDAPSLAVDASDGYSPELAEIQEFVDLHR